MEMDERNAGETGVPIDWKGWAKQASKGEEGKGADLQISRLTGH